MTQSIKQMQRARAEAKRQKRIINELRRRRTWTPEIIEVAQ